MARKTSLPKLGTDEHARCRNCSKWTRQELSPLVVVGEKCLGSFNEVLHFWFSGQDAFARSSRQDTRSISLETQLQLIAQEEKRGTVFFQHAILESQLLPQSSCFCAQFLWVKQRKGTNQAEMLNELASARGEAQLRICQGSAVHFNYLPSHQDLPCNQPARLTVSRSVTRIQMTVHLPNPIPKYRDWIWVGSCSNLGHPDPDYCLPANLVTYLRECLHLLSEIAFHLNQITDPPNHRSTLIRAQQDVNKNRKVLESECQKWSTIRIHVHFILIPNARRFQGVTACYSAI